MASIQPPASVPCSFRVAWKGACGCPTDNGRCDTHQDTKCAVCGKPATQECDYATSLVCGVPLCDTCRHHPQGGMGRHVTGEEYDRITGEMSREEETKRASRSSPEPRIDEALGIPVNLFELLKTDWAAAGFERRMFYFLELKHGLMGFFPAVFDREMDGEEPRIVVTTDLRVLESVWHLLEPRKAKLVEARAYVHPELGYAYGDVESPHEQEYRTPMKLLTRAEFDAMDKSGEEPPFRWSYGLLSMSANPSRESFLEDLVGQARKFDPSFGRAA